MQESMLLGGLHACMECERAERATLPYACVVDRWGSGHATLLDDAIVQVCRKLELNASLVLLRYI
eukprot:1161234-Pelagomonas_calceolata.AAC.5